MSFSLYKVLIAALLALTLCVDAKEGDNVELIMDKDKLQTEACQAVKAKIALIESGGLPAEVAADYFKAYGLDVGDAHSNIYLLNVTICNTACYEFCPKNPKGCVILVHGYLDHAMSWRKTIPRLLEEGYMLLLYDLKGHGFSDGARADIGDFSEYREQLANVVDFAAKRGHKLHVIAHSTGAGVLADLLMHDKTHADMIYSAVLIAPLLHSAHWGVSRTALSILPLKSVKRSFRKNSSDDSFKAFQKADPLQYDRIPVSWTNANAAWAKRMVASSSVYDGSNVLFIQGDKDKVVDWKYNMKYYGKKFPKGTFSIYAKTRHQLMNESPQIIETLLDEIVKWLGKEQEFTI